MNLFFLAAPAPSPTGAHKPMSCEPNVLYYAHGKVLNVHRVLYLHCVSGSRGHPPSFRVTQLYGVAATVEAAICHVTPPGCLEAPAAGGIPPNQRRGLRLRYFTRWPSQPIDVF